MAGLAAVWIVLAVVSAQSGAAQDNEPAAAAAPTDANPGVVKGEPFSATKYSRRVKNLPDGKQQFLRNEHYPVKIARDSEGRVRIEIVELPNVECDKPEMLVPPPCPSWGVLVFDPISGTVTHWPEGEIGAHVSVTLIPSPSQIAEAEDSTSNLPAQSGMTAEDGAEMTTQSLGSKDIDGISAIGVRTTSVIAAGHFGSKDPIVRIHEVWTSAEMKLVVKIIDGDPNGDETISGLDHVSLAPGAALFQPPEGYEIQVRNEPKFLGTGLEGDLHQMAEWFVR